MDMKLSPEHAGRSSRRWCSGGACAALAGIVLTALLVAFSPAHAALQAGAAKLTITPPECSVGGPCPGYPLAGAGTGRWSTGVHDDIWVRALVITDGEDSVILVTVDVLGHLPDRIRGMATAIQAAYPQFAKVLVHDDGVSTPVVQRYADGREVIANVLIANAHTHASPDCLGIYGPDDFTTGRRPVWMDYVDSRVVEVVGMAIDNLQPAKVRFGHYYVPDYLGFPLITDRREPIVVDHNMEVMQLANSGTGEAICTLVNYSGYPELMGGDNTEMTADFPGVMDQNLEAYFGGTSIWVTRVIGGYMMSYYDVNFNGIRDDDEYPPNQHLHSFPGMTAYGNYIAEIAKEALDEVPYEGSPGLTLKTNIVNAPIDNPFWKVLLGEANYVIPGLLGDFWDWLAGLVGFTSLVEPTPAMMLDHEGQGALGAPRKAELPVTVFELGSAMFTTTPSQLFPELWTGTSPADLMANPAWDFNPSQRNNPNFEYHPRLPGLTGIRDFITAEHAFNFGSTHAELGYLLPSYEYDHSIKTYNDFVNYVIGVHQVRYEESQSVGRGVGDMVQTELIRMISEFNAGLVH
jgi:hypothetical protein